MSPVSAINDFQAMIRADEDLAMHCFGFFLHTFLLLGGFMVVQHFLDSWCARSCEPAPQKVGATKAATSRASVRTIVKGNR